MFEKLFDDLIKVLFVAGVIVGVGLVGIVWAVCKIVPHIHLWWS